jgi:hypothetical protein
MSQAKLVNRAIWILVGLIALYVFYKSKHDPKPLNSMEQSRVAELQSNTTAHEIANKYEAVSGWEDGVIYTAHVQQKILNKPALFRGHVDDIVNQGDAFLLTFSSAYGAEVEYVLRLRCDGNVINKVLERKHESRLETVFDEYALVATLDKIYKPIYSLAGSVTDENEAEIEASASDLFIGKGTCIDIVGLNK